MNISRLKAQYQGGAISKPEFISQALELHSTLFDYIEVTATTDVREIRIDKAGVSFLIGDDAIRLHAPPGEARVAPLEIMNFDQYEPHETMVMDVLAGSATQILDIGANIGWYTTRFAKRLPRARIYAFEPLPTSFSYLQRNIAANGVGERAMALNYGLSDACGSFEFFISPTHGTNASLKNVADAPDAQRIICLTMTVDQWVANNHVAPDFIKCDVEGAELLVFRGARKTLAEHRPVVFTEMLRKWSKPFGYHPNDAIHYFGELGYRCAAVGHNGIRWIEHIDDETVETNYAFLHATFHVELISRLGMAHD